MNRRRIFWIFVLAFGLSIPTSVLRAQGAAGRVFNATADTVSIHEFNDFPGLNDGDVIPTGTTVTDLSGNGLNATVEANDQGDLKVNAGDPNFDVPAGSDREVRRTAFITPGARVAVNNDRNSYEMSTTDDFTIELYVNREHSMDLGNWGILAGTWHSRNLIDDAVGNPDANGAWYGYGLIRYQEALPPPQTGGWGWVLSPVTAGQPIVGFTNGPEKFLQPWFEIPDGRHYVVFTMDRTAQSAIGYVDGVEVTRMDGLDPNWDFTTPAGRDHARFLMFTGENDSTLGTWMPGPQGTHLDSVRVQRKAMTADEVGEVWNNILLGIPSPPEGEMKAIILAKTEALVDECILLNGATSAAGPGRVITKYEWKLGATGTYEVGDATREVSFGSASSTEGVEVSLRITNDILQTAATTLKIVVKDQSVVAKIAASLGATVLRGKNLIIPLGSVLSLDGTGSSSTVPLDAFICPLGTNTPLEPSPIAEYSWDLDGNGTTDDTRPSFDTDPFNTVKDFTITLKVRNEANQTAQASINVKVADSKGNSNIFHTTGNTIFHLEFNEQPVGEAPDGTVYPDLSGSGLELTVVDPNITGDLAVQDGALHLADNRALAYVAGGAGPRGEVRNDGGIFEMDETMDFTFEIYVRPGELDQPQWGDVAGTFKARTDGTEDSARYGWGIIKSHLDNPAENLGGYMWFICSGLGGAAEYKVDFQLEKNVWSYVACVVDRVAQRATVYVNGVHKNELALDPTWSFVTPAGYPPAPFYLFTREQVTGQFSNCVPDTAADALRFQTIALSADDVMANWENIAAGIGADPPPAPNPPQNLTATAGDGKVDLAWDLPSGGGPFTNYEVFRDGSSIVEVLSGVKVYTDSAVVNGTKYCYVVKATRAGSKSADSNEACATPTGTTPGGFKRGDANADGAVDLSDPVNVLGYLFLGNPATLVCPDAGDSDDSGELDITDAVYSLNWQFLGGKDIPSPGPFTCGPDPTATDPLPACAYPQEKCTP